MNKIIRSIFLVLFYIPLIFLLGGCKKYLEEKSDKKLTIPSTLSNFQSILDNYSTMNNNICIGGEVSSDDYYLQEESYQSLAEDNDRRMYTWQKDNVYSSGGNDWYYLYFPLYSSATVLEGLEKIEKTSSSQKEWDNIKGQALLFRANRLLAGVSVFCVAYDPQSAAIDLGLPLRLSTNFNERSNRASLQATYDQIISDAKEAIPLLNTTPLTFARPSRQAAYGVLARTYLWMRNYRQAGLYADSCLRISNALVDFNTLDQAAENPIVRTNIEYLFISYLRINEALYYYYNHPKVSKSLYSSYAENDLRKTIFYADNGDGTHAFKGGYNGDGNLSFGISTDEMYLIRAESYARQNYLAEAMRDLNDLLIKRWRIDATTKKTLYVNQTAIDKADALSKILSERRKELPFRGLRWMDIKRLNKEGANISLTRIIGGNTYTLPANDLRFALAIPEDVIALSGMPQNPR